MFPLEVEFLIIEQLEDKTSLSACSRVCRAWLACSRSFLFSDLLIRLPKKHSGRLEAFGRFLARSSRSPHPLGRYVKHLALRGEDAGPSIATAYSLGDCLLRASKDSELAQLADCRFFPAEGSDDAPDDCTSISVASLRAVLSLCPQLEVLDLERLLFYDIPTCQPCSLLEAFHPRPLHALLIEDCSSTTRDMRHLFGLLNMFTSIDRLFVDCGPWELPVDDPSYELSPASPIIRDLTLQALEDADCATVFYDALRRSGSLDGPLKVVQFACYARGEVVDFFSFLQDAGKHLTELNIDMYFPLRWSRGEPGSWDALGLDCCPNLEKLTLVFDFDAPDEMLRIRDAVLQTALQLYTRLLLSTSRGLREVSFCIYGAANARLAFTRSAAAHEGRERWAALDRTLSGPATGGVPALVSVKFLLCDVDGEGELDECKAGLAEFVAECMPAVAARGLVCLRSEREEYPS